MCNVLFSEYFFGFIDGSIDRLVKSGSYFRSLLRLLGLSLRSEFVLVSYLSIVVATALGFYCGVANIREFGFLCFKLLVPGSVLCKCDGFLI